MFCCALLYVHSSFAIILMGKRELVVLLCLSSWCLVIVVWLFLTMQQVCLQFVIVIFPSVILTYYFAIISLKAVNVITFATVKNKSAIFIFTTLTNFSTKYLVMCKVHTDVGGIK